MMDKTAYAEDVRRSGPAEAVRRTMRSTICDVEAEVTQATGSIEELALLFVGGDIWPDAGDCNPTASDLDSRLVEVAIRLRRLNHALQALNRSTS